MTKWFGGFDLLPLTIYLGGVEFKINSIVPNPYRNRPDRPDHLPLPTVRIRTIERRPRDREDESLANILSVSPSLRSHLFPQEVSAICGGICSRRAALLSISSQLGWRTRRSLLQWLSSLSTVRALPLCIPARHSAFLLH